MSIIDDIIVRWVDIIDRPIAINNKQGFVLNNGIKIILEKSELSLKSKERLSRHYERQKKKRVL
jgi:hypothetical protein